MTYTIRRGDTLSALAQRFNTTVSALQKRNNIADPDRIYAGDALDIPDAEIAPVRPAQTAGTPQSAGRWSGAGAASVPAYQRSDTLGALAADVARLQQSKAEPYKSPYAERIAKVLDELETREAFTYDYQDDPLYTQYKDSYTQSGRLAMQDAMGSAAALTGGYGSSYAQSVGQQTYGAYMQALNDKIPALAADAYDQYVKEGAAIYEKLDAYGELDADTYGKYRDSMADYYDDLAYYTGQYNKAAQNELAAYEAQIEAYAAAQAQAYKEAQAAQTQANWEKEYALKLDKNSAAKNSGSAAGKSTASSGKSAATTARSAEAEKIYALFVTMLPSERRAMLANAKSAAYIIEVLGQAGYAALKEQYGA